MKFKTGLVRSPQPPGLQFGAYLQPQLLPPLPPTFGHQSAYPPREWGMLGNDRISDCTVAGAMHVIMAWRASINNPVRFSVLDAEEDYSAITGGKDTGADMVSVAKYWQTTGFRDRRANRHHILAYMNVDPNNLDHIDAACYLFGAVGLGVLVGQNEENAFLHQQPWAYPTYERTDYHYVPMIGKTSQYRQVITWGGLQDVTENWLRPMVQEVVAVLTDENLIAGKSLEGFDLNALEADLAEIGRA